MGIASSMRELASGIASSHEDRTKAVLEIREEANRVSGDARTLVKDFQTSRSETGAELRKDLARDKASRESDVERMRGDAQGLMKQFHMSRGKRDVQLREGLARGAAGRRADVDVILENARQAVRGFQSQRKEAGGRLREELARGQSSRESDVEELLKGAQDLVSGFAKSREEAAKTLRTGLARGRDERESAVKALATEVNKMRAGFGESRTAVRGEINEARIAWQGLARGIRKAAVETAAESARGKAKEIPEADDEGSPDLEAKLLAAIKDHPQGITLTEVADSMSVAPIVLGRAVRRLLDEYKVRKEEKAYFPVAGE